MTLAWPTSDQDLGLALLLHMGRLDVLGGGGLLAARIEPMTFLLRT